MDEVLSSWWGLVILLCGGIGLAVLIVFLLWGVSVLFSSTWKLLKNL